MPQKMNELVKFQPYLSFAIAKDIEPFTIHEIGKVELKAFASLLALRDLCSSS